VLRNGLLRYILYVQTCNVPRVQSATECLLGFRVSLQVGYLNGGLTGTFREKLRGRFLKEASSYFQRELNGGSYFSSSHFGSNVSIQESGTGPPQKCTVKEFFFVWMLHGSTKVVVRAVALLSAKTK